MYMSENNWVSYLPLGLAVALPILIMYNWRGRRTIIALILAVIGSSLVFLTHQLYLTAPFYDYGSIILFVSVWLNSSLLAVINYMWRFFKSLKASWQQ